MKHGKSYGKENKASKKKDSKNSVLRKAYRNKKNKK